MCFIAIPAGYPRSSPFFSLHKSDIAPSSPCRIFDFSYSFYSFPFFDLVMSLSFFEVTTYDLVHVGFSVYHNTYIHTSLHLYLSPLSLSSLHLFFPHFKKLDLVFVLRGMFRLHLTFFFSLFVSSLNSRRLVMITTTWTGFLPFYSLFLQVLSSSLDSIASFLVSFPLSCLYPHLIPLHLQLTLQVTNLHIILRGRHTDSYPHFFLSPYTYIYAHIYNSYIAAYSPPPPPLPFSRYITTGSRQILFLARLRLSTL